MYDIYIKCIHINKIRHLKDIDIIISDNTKKHLILTGKNGSGKTSLLDAIANQLNFLSTEKDYTELEKDVDLWKTVLRDKVEKNASENEIREAELNLKENENSLLQKRYGLIVTYSELESGMRAHFKDNDYILGFFAANRKLKSKESTHIEKPDIKSFYEIKSSPREEFIKYIADKKVTEALDKTDGSPDKLLEAESINRWFSFFENKLKEIFDDKSTELIFDTRTYNFSIVQEGKEPFSFNQLSDGFAAVLDIVVDIMMRMESHSDGKFSYDMPGIVLIDEIETHLHLELQKQVMSFLTGLFPNVQFIVSTHSPFIINSTENAVVYDIENGTYISDGLTNLPYEGIVEGYFNVDKLSKELKDKLTKYKELTVLGKECSDDDKAEILELENYLEEIPDYLALDLSEEFNRLREEYYLREKESING